MKLKVFQASSMAEAMTKVKKDLGKDAVILHTRAFKIGGFLGFGGRACVEVTATSDPAVLQPEFLRKRGKQAPLPSTPPSAPTPGPLSAPTSAPTSAPPAGPPSSSPRTTPSPQAAKSPNFIASTYGAMSSSTPASSLEPKPDPRPAPALDAPSARPLSPAPASLPPADIARHVAELRDLVGHLAHLSTGAPLPPSLHDAHTRLLRADIDPRLVGQLIWSIRDTLGPDELRSEQVINHALVRRLEKLLPKAADLQLPQPSADGRPFTIALIGPTGAGKTTTVAKLAAAFKIRHGLRVGLITADTYRIAAVEQLRTYASIIGLPLKVALTRGDIEQALLELADCQVVLIDTAGRSPGDDSKLAELQDYLSAARPHQTHLLLSGVLGKRSLQHAAQAYGKLRPDHILLTKLDEAASLGALLELAHFLPAAKLSYFTTGQEVPDDIEPGCPRRLARCIIESSIDSPRTFSPSLHPASASTMSSTGAAP